MATTGITVDPTTGETTEVRQERTKITVSFSRKISPKQYESAEASVFIEAEVGLDATETDKVNAIADAFRVGKAAVYEQLGIGMDVGSKGDISEARAALESVLGQVTEAPAPRSNARPSTNGGGVSPWDGLDRNAAKKVMWEDLAANPQDWYDNRRTATGAQPQFKHRNKDWNGALWTEYKGKSVVPQDLVIPDTGFANKDN